VTQPVPHSAIIPCHHTSSEIPTIVHNFLLKWNGFMEDCSTSSSCLHCALCVSIYFWTAV